MSDTGKQPMKQMKQMQIRTSIPRPMVAAMLLAGAVLALEPDLAPLAHAPAPTISESLASESSHAGAWETGAF